MKGGESGGEVNPETSKVMCSGFFCVLIIAEKPAVPMPVKQTEPAPRKSTEAESDRRTAIWLALNAIKRFVKSPFRTEFFAEQSDQRSFTFALTE